MATHHLHHLHHHSLRRHHRHNNIKFQPLDSSNSISSIKFQPLDSSHNSISSSSTFFPKSPTQINSSTTSTTPSTSTTFSLDLLHHHLSGQNFRQADEETRRLLIILAGEAAVKRGYVFFSEVKFIDEEDLKAIDELWKKHSDNKFGYSVQKRIFITKSKKDFSNFFIKVGWMKKLDTEIEQFNYRAFPNEFIWELNDDTPEGHLPLTNALRGTQLLRCIFDHPAFKDEIEQDEEVEGAVGEEEGLRAGSRLLSKKVFKTDYGF